MSARKGGRAAPFFPNQNFETRRPLFPQQRTFIKATAANSTRIDAARNKPPHPELIDKFADWLIALSSGGLFAWRSNFLRMNESVRLLIALEI